MNLIQKYGTRWFRSKFNGTYFMHRGIPAVIQTVHEHKPAVAVAMHHRTGGEVKSMIQDVPYDTFMDHKMFSVPELGYRHSQGGKWLGYISRNNSSYVRGVGTQNIRTQESNLTRSLRRMGVKIANPTPGELCNMVLDPGFIPFYKGIKLMLDGKIVSFAASPTIAVVPTPDEDTFTIMMCSREVGTVSADGEISMALPFAKTYIEETVCN